MATGPIPKPGFARARRGLAWGAFLLALPIAAGAASSYPVQVGATILSKNNCKFNTTSGTINFPAIDPSSPTAVTASVPLTIVCTGSGNPAVYTITSNDGQHPLGAGQPQMADTGAANLLPYTLNMPLPGSVPRNTPTSVLIQGTITPAQFANAAATSYTDLVVLTISP